MIKFSTLLQPNSIYLKQVGSLVGGVLIAQVIMLAATPLISRLYSPEAFGLFGVLIAISSMLSLFASFRIEVLIPVVRKHQHAIALVGFVLMWSFLFSAVIGIIVYFFGKEIAKAFSLPAGVYPYLYFLPGLIFSYSVYSVLRYYQIRLGTFRRISFSQIGRAIVNVASSIAAALGPFGVLANVGLAIGQFLGDVAFGSGLLKFRKRDAFVIRNLSKSKIEDAIGSNIGIIRSMFLSQIIAAVYQRIPIFLIAANFGPINAGYYFFGEKIISAPLAMIAVPIGDVYRKRAFDLLKKTGQFVEEFKRTLIMGLSIFTIPFAIAILLTPYVMGPVFGAQWGGASDVLIVMLVGGYLSTIVQPIDKGALLVGAERYLYQYHILRFVQEAILALLVVMGMLSILNYLWLGVGVRFLIYLWQLLKEYGFSSTGRA